MPTGTPRSASTSATPSQPKIVGTLEETGVDSTGQSVLLNDKFRTLGIHSHEDGIIHYHPASTKSSGNRAKLGVFLDSYDIKLTDSRMVMPPEQGGEKWSTEDTKCDGKDTQLVVRVWDRFDNPNAYHDVVTDFNNIRITNDGMVFVVAFVPKGTDIPMPDWAAELPTLGAADGGAVIATPRRRRPVTPRRHAHGRHHRRHRTGDTTVDTGTDDRAGIHQHDRGSNNHHRRLMRAVVLVGGFGTRLRPLTLTTPKPMLPVGHVPIIERLVDNLARGGVTDVTLALGFKAEPFIEAFPDGECNGVALHYAVEPEPLDTAGAIRFAADFSGIDDTFVVANGDVLTDLDIGALSSSIGSARPKRPFT